MKYLLSIFSVILLHHCMTGQTSTPISISFGHKSYQIVQAKPCAQMPATDIPDDLQFFYDHFREEDYMVYRSFYPDNSCLASADDFRNWRQQISTKEITPITSYRLYGENDTLSIISYSITSAISTQFFPFALQRKENKWFLFELRKSEALMNLKMFMAFVHPEFIISFLENPEEMKAQYMSTIFTAKGSLNGDLLMNYYDARYDPVNARHGLALQAFQPVAVFPPSIAESIEDNIRTLATEFNLPNDKVTILENMARDGNYSMALGKIAEWSGTSDVIEITSKFNSRMNVHSTLNGQK